MLGVAAVYALAAALFAAAGVSRRSVWADRGRLVAVLGLAAHTAVALSRLGDSRIPFRDLSGTLFVLAGFLALIGVAARRAGPAAAAAAAALAATAAAASALGPAGEPAGALDAPVGALEMHAGLLVVAYALFALAAIAGAMYLLKERELKGRRPGALYHRLPPLERCGALLGAALRAGFAFYTLGLLVGAAMLLGLAERTGPEPKLVAASLVWLLYGAGLLGTRQAGARGRQARFALLGAAAVLVVFLGLAFAPGLHGVR